MKTQKEHPVRTAINIYWYAYAALYTETHTKKHSKGLKNLKNVLFCISNTRILQIILFFTEIVLWRRNRLHTRIYLVVM